MVGGGNRRDEGSFVVSNTNVFAALESLRKKKKKSGKEKGSSQDLQNDAAGKSKNPEEKPHVFWSPTPLKLMSWADVEDEEDDDYYATTAPPQAIWAGSGLSKAEETPQSDHVEESESEDELLDGGDDDVDEEHEHELEAQQPSEPIVNNPVEVSPAPKQTERQLSKRERKKKELAELDAILADFGLNPREKSEDEPSDATNEKKQGQLNGDAEKDIASRETKSAKKKKKKKDKAPKEVTEPQGQPDSSDVNEQEETAASEETDTKERLKKMASAKKKKSSKEMDAAARAASAEAAARSAKLAAAKKKEKNHYNQQPVR